MDGDPPDLPSEGFSNAARDFVRGCLNKTPKLRPTYAMLLRHAWLAPLLKPPTIPEGEEEEGEEANNFVSDMGSVSSDTADRDVARWVREAIQSRHDGKISRKTKPALHTAPLDTIPSPSTVTDS